MELITKDIGCFWNIRCLENASGYKTVVKD